MEKNNNLRDSNLNSISTLLSNGAALIILTLLFSLVLWLIFNIVGAHYNIEGVKKDNYQDVGSILQGIGNQLQAIIGIAVGFAGALVVIVIARDTQKIMDLESRRDGVKQSLKILNNTSNKFQNIAQAFKRLNESIGRYRTDNSGLWQALLRLSVVPDFGLTSEEIGCDYTNIDVEERGRRILICLQLSSERSVQEYPNDPDADLVLNNFPPDEDQRKWAQDALCRLEHLIDKHDYRGIFEYAVSAARFRDEIVEDIKEALEEFERSLRAAAEDFECNLLSSHINIEGDNRLLELKTLHAETRLIIEKLSSEEIQECLSRARWAIPILSVLGRQFDPFDFSLAFSISQARDKCLEEAIGLTCFFNSFRNGGYRNLSSTELGISGGIMWYKSVVAMLPSEANYKSFIKEVVMETESSKLPEFIQKSIKLIDSKHIIGDEIVFVSNLFDKNSFRLKPKSKAVFPDLSEEVPHAFAEEKAEIRRYFWEERLQNVTEQDAITTLSYIWVFGSDLMSVQFNELITK